MHMHTSKHREKECLNWRLNGQTVQSSCWDIICNAVKPCIPIQAHYFELCDWREVVAGTQKIYNECMSVFAYSRFGRSMLCSTPPQLALYSTIDIVHILRLFTIIGMQCVRVPFPLSAWFHKNCSLFTLWLLLYCSLHIHSGFLITIIPITLLLQ